MSSDDGKRIAIVNKRKKVIMLLTEVFINNGVTNPQELADILALLVASFCKQANVNVENIKHLISEYMSKM